MSKVLKVVAIVAIAVAVVVFAPAIGAALASVAGSLGVTITGAAIASAFTTMAITAALTAGASLFRKAPSMSNSMADRLRASVNPTAPRKIVFGLTAAGADVPFVETYGKKKDRSAQIIVLASHKINRVVGYYVENDLTWSGSLIRHADGIENMRFVTQGANNGFSYGTGNYWKPTAKFTGCAYMALTWKLSNDAWPGGLPSETRTIVEGCPVYDPRLDSSTGGSGPHRIDDQSTWTWKNGSVEIGRNPALCLLTYLTGYKIAGQTVWGMGIPASSIDLDNFRYYANVCEERVALLGGGTVQRYHCDAIYSTADAHETVIGGITAAMGSTKLVDVGGAYTLVGGVDDTAGPKVSLTADDLVGPPGGASPYVWNPAPAARDRFNIIRGRFADPDNLYQLSDWGDPIIQPPLADGVPRTMNLDLGAVSRPETCQRIAKQFLLREYLTPGKFSATFSPKAFAANVGSLVTLTIPKEGWNAKLFRVESQAETHDMWFQMTLREESAAVYAWDREEKPLPPSIRPEGYDPADTLAPENFRLTSHSYAGANNYDVSEVHVAWTPEDSGRVQGIQIQSRAVGVDSWTNQATLFDANVGTYTFTSNAPGVTLEVRARFRMTTAVYGSWVTANVATAAVVVRPDWDNVLDPSGTRPDANADVTGDHTSKDTAAVGGVPSGTLLNNVNAALANQRDPQGNLILISDVKAAVDAANGRIDTANGQITTANGQIVIAKNRADAAYAVGSTAQQNVDSLGTSVNTRFQGVNDNAASLSTRITAVSDANGALAVRTSNLETDSGSAKTRITAVETAVTDGRFATAQRAAIIETSLSGALGRISNVETATTDGRFATATRAGNIETSLNGALGRIGAVETATTDGRFATTQRLNTVEATANGFSGRISSVETATTDGRFASAGTLNQLRSEYNGTAATVTTQAGTLTGLQSKTAAYWSVQADAGNGRAQLTVYSDAYGSAGVDIVGDVRITGSNGGGRTIVSRLGMEVYDANNIRRVQLGIF
ncbi:hypothetical protein KCP91_12065 [Microvirga sp. SRT01]|uniref:Tip attachment protein J domain-containing protein n=1 Tax=Sphingomonas longa TaxID=2778730 RepID=A0ABS2D880_9SPHN|nr:MULTISPECIES: hypothetical protein [Alphaproteobacteria]MBM6577108.1 hypothetical protein [Sphingomonas sp. BT552]MBR7710152.1 hypothetical protein [Microvirga sp. SRT01]